MEEDHRSYRCNFCSCEKKPWKNSGLYGIQTLLPVGLFVQLVERYTSITEAKGLNPVQAWLAFFSQLQKLYLQLQWQLHF